MRKQTEELYWGEFIEWLKDVSFDPRNGECIDTIFWWWYITKKLPELPSPQGVSNG